MLYDSCTKVGRSVRRWTESTYRKLVDVVNLFEGPLRLEPARSLFPME